MTGKTPLADEAEARRDVERVTHFLALGFSVAAPIGETSRARVAILDGAQEAA